MDPALGSPLHVAHLVPSRDKYILKDDKRKTSIADIQQLTICALNLIVIPCSLRIYPDLRICPVTFRKDTSFARWFVINRSACERGGIFTFLLAFIHGEVLWAKVLGIPVVEPESFHCYPFAVFWQFCKASISMERNSQKTSSHKRNKMKYITRICSQLTQSSNQQCSKETCL